MNHDPIVAEVRQTRQNILEECGGSLEKLLDRLKVAEAQDQSRVVSWEAIRQRFQSKPAAQTKR